MKSLKTIGYLVAAIATMAAPAYADSPGVTAGTGPNTAQYHSYDGLICTDCHTLHASEDGAPIAAGAAPATWAGGSGYTALLYKGDFTDVCLSCHKQGFNTSATADLPSVVDSGWTAPIVMTLDGVDPAGISMPAGDFFWSNDDPKKGHNPAYTEGSAVATSKLMAADTTLGNVPPGSPGGAAVEGEWSCHSCHGMHSRFSSSYTAWRQVQRKINGHVVTGDVSGYGVETTAGNKVQDPAFEPILSNSRGDIQGTDYVNTRGDGNAVQGADLFADYSDTNKNVYQGGFSSFCSACHGDFHGGTGETRAADNGNTRVGGEWIKHPTNVALNEAGSKYGINTYTATITNEQGTNPNPVGYDWRYPVVKANADFTVTSTVASMTDGTSVDGNERIMCLTCHKAHASKFENMTRWDTNAHSFIADGDIDVWGTASNGDNPAYGCGKCHQKGGTKAFVKKF